MSVEAIADDFTKAVAEGRDADAQKHWSDDVVSLEPGDAPHARCEGREAVLEKHAWWEANTEVHNVKTEGPFVMGDQFAVRYEMDVTMDGKRNQMREIGLYTVKDDKVVEERFMYGEE